jgi:hypothetical protein
MQLNQDDQPFVFDGVVLGGLYTGTLYFHGHAYSHFCAAKGEAAPKSCDTSRGVAMAVTRPACNYRGLGYGLRMARFDFR